MEEDDRHPISGDRIPDEGDLDSDGDDELLDGRSASHKSARSGSASLQSNTMLSNLLDPSSAHEPFDEWESLPPKYLVSDSKTYLAYFKAFVGAGVLFLPSAFKDGGLTTSVVAFVVTTLLSTICMIKMVEAKRRLVVDFRNGQFHGVKNSRKVISFGMLGRVATGSNWGRWMVDVSIAVSQLCFGTSALIFTSKNLHEILFQLGNCEAPWNRSPVSLIWLLVPLLLPTMFIRQLAKFAVSILVADVFIVGGLLYLYYNNAHLIVAQGGLGPGIIQFDGIGFWSLLATAIYALEGTSFVLPIEHAMENKQNFNRITYISGLSIGFMYMSFGLLGYMAYGANISSIITLNLKSDNPHSIAAVALQLCYCLALLAAFPVTLFPPVRLVEAKLFPTQLDAENRKVTTARLTWSKNGVRVFMTVLCAVMATGGGSSFSNFISLVGGLMCVPLTLTFPAWFHLVICGDTCTPWQRFEDYVCIAVGVVGTFACTGLSIYQWVNSTASAGNACVPS